MSNEKFFVVLPSDSSSGIYPDNKTSSYKTHLPSGINVDPSKWEVALQEVQFPHSWYNVREGKNVIIKKYHNVYEKEIDVLKNLEGISTENVFDTDVISRRITVPSGVYHTIEDLLKTLNDLEQNDVRPIAFQFDKTSRRVKALVGLDCTLNWNNSDVAKFLGFHPHSSIYTPSAWEFSEEVKFRDSEYNIREGRNTIIKTYYGVKQHKMALLATTNEKIVSSYTREITVPPGTYNTLTALVEVLEKAERNDPRQMLFKFDKTSKRWKVQIGLNCTLDWNSSDIAKCLGFQPGSRIYSTTKYIEERSLIVSGTSLFDSLYVYTDIIENQQVGDYKVPLLRVIPVRSKFGEINWIHYDRPHFLKLSRENIDSIELNIRDETGELVPFESGKVLVTLVFRRITAKFYQ